MSTPTPRTDAAWASSFEPCEYRAAHTARTMRDECAKLECELATAKAILASIEEDGTEEHNAAVRLRQELATERARLRQLALDSCRAAAIIPVVWYPAGYYVNPKILGKINKQQVDACVAAIDAAMKEGA